MTSSGYFCYLAGATGDFLMFFGLVTVPLFIAASFAIWWAGGQVGVRRGWVLVASASPAIFPIAALIIGVAFVEPSAMSWGDSAGPTPWIASGWTERASHALQILTWLTPVLVFAVSWWAMRRWPAALAMSLWWSWLTLCAVGVAGMSVTGTWL